MKRGPPPVDPATARAIGAALRSARRAAGRSQDDLALAMGVSAQQIQSYEIGRNSVSAVGLLLAARFLGVQPSYLLGRYDLFEGALVEFALFLRRQPWSALQASDVLLEQHFLRWVDELGEDDARTLMSIATQMIHFAKRGEIDQFLKDHERQHILKEQVFRSPPLAEGLDDLYRFWLMTRISPSKTLPIPQ